MERHVDAWALSAAQLDSLVQRIQRIIEANRLQAAVRVGQLVLAEVYGGQEDRVDRLGDDHPSFRQLAQHPALPCSHVYLWRCVRVVLQQPHLGSLASDLTFSHQVALLQVRAFERKVDLAARAVAEKWSVRRLLAEVRGDKPVAKAARRTRSPGKVFGQLDRLATQLSELVAKDADAWRRGCARDRARAVQTLDVLRASLAALQSELTDATPPDVLTTRLVSPPRVSADAAPPH